jgi:hypothetical protein
MVVQDTIESDLVLSPDMARSGDIEVLIKEAKRHQRRRYVAIALVITVVAVAVVAVGLAGRHGSTSLRAPKHRETEITPAVARTCRADQLAIQYRGSQGATGNIASGFWIANLSGTPCSLRSSVTVDLLNSTGATQLSASKSLTSPIELTANTSMPPGGVVPQGDKLGFVVLFWPTIPDAAASVGVADGQCPQPLFLPSAVRIDFKGIAAIRVPQFPASLALSAPLSLCGSQFSIDMAGPLTG